MPVIGAEIVAKNITTFGENFVNHVNKCFDSVKIMLDDQVTFNISLTDHSLSDLRRLGHPYRIGGPGLHGERSFQVHKQSGELLASKKSGTEKASINFGTLKASAWVSLDTEYVDYLIWGTSKMIPREFMTESLNRTKDQAINFLRENLRDLVINWKPKS